MKEAEESYKKRKEKSRETYSKKNSKKKSKTEYVNFCLKNARPLVKLKYIILTDRE